MTLQKIKLLGSSLLTASLPKDNGTCEVDENSRRFAILTVDNRAASLSLYISKHLWKKRSILKKCWVQKSFKINLHGPSEKASRYFETPLLLNGLLWLGPACHKNEYDGFECGLPRFSEMLNAQVQHKMAHCWVQKNSKNALWYKIQSRHPLKFLNTLCAYTRAHRPNLHCLDRPLI